MIFVLELRFSDDPARLAARSAHRDKLARLAASGELLMAGPWHDDSGALLVFHADRARMDAIVAADPYFTTAGVTVESLREWRPVVGAPSSSRTLELGQERAGTGSPGRAAGPPAPGSSSSSTSTTAPRNCAM